MDMPSRFIAPGMGFILTLVFGIWLSVSGKPYGAVLFNVHKLVALAAAILTGIAMYNVLRDAETSALYVGLVIVAGLGAAALFFSGAMMSAERLRYTVMLTIHRVALIAVAVSVAATVYLLSAHKP